MNTKELLFYLSNMHGVSGDEEIFCKELSDFLKREYNFESRMISGNLVSDFGKREKDKKHVLIDAHIDEIGMICTYIDSQGFIIPGNIGGMDYRILPAQRVIVHGVKDIPGVISAIPPHLSGGKSVHSDMSNIRIDTGYSAEELRKIVFPGCTVSFDVEAKNLAYKKITGKSLDNRIGAAAIILAAEQLLKYDVSCSYTLLFSSSEEIGERGAKTACFEVDPDIAIAVDTSFAFTSGEHIQKCGLIGKGPMIGVSPSLSSEISDLLKNAAHESGIPYQIEVMNRLTGTNADQFSVSRNGVKTGLCSIPIKYMHTPAETAEITDIENTAKLISEFIRRIK